MQWYEGRDDEIINVQLADIGTGMPMINSKSQIGVDPDGKPRERSQDSPTQEIAIIVATAFDDLLTSDVM